ncbi:5-(carboxyamino)imidazole ribonucleotide synthase [Mycoplana dimorpha]|uniref:N5-carboxyaminoimidazole ribonucleotide synthase n=1 Tax=Mycoplana dimorpha TaxID=28320 RepID=A0A2T5B5V1_MYCDI|nr:5-(carboxyamino)imidazole ribonucleotide synthase [Mycoplana dimorpha]PTM94369.1 5-(carboxyamino)imidazole ribonucleotide synthase [Mycoplana dimorpha]
MSVRTVGIIGGGQLGRMLAMAAARLGIRTVVLEPQADCPAAQVANAQIVAAYDDPAALEALAGQCDVVTYEFENVPVGAAERLAHSVRVFPPPRALEVSQDRLVEKRFINDCGVATAPFEAVDSQAELEAALDGFGGIGVLKTRRMGYDGKGQRMFRSPAESRRGVFAALGSVPLILEGLIAFEREISIIAARAQDGTIVCYDPAENVHRDGILHTSTVPAAISEATADQARRAARAILDRLDYVGVIGVEFFVLGDGQLVANEMAPRVHNSGHWTEAACVISQFEQHMRAVAGLSLGDGRRHSDCVMYNLIGDDIETVPAWLKTPDALVHLYGKTESRPCRKMGHVTKLR